MNAPAPISRTMKALRSLASGKSPLCVPNVVSVFTLTADEGIDDLNHPEYHQILREALERADDDTILNLYAEAKARIDEVTAPLRWAVALAESDIERRLFERRAARGENDTAPISIPHARIDVVNEVQFGPYSVDVDTLEEATRGLADDERKKLLVVFPEEHVPEQVIPAHTIPRKVQPGNITTILAWIKRNAGSAQATIAQSAITRPRLGSKTTIRPKKLAPPVKTVAPIGGAQ